MPIYGKKRLKKSSSELQMSLKLGLQHLAHKHYQVCFSDDPRLTFDHLSSLYI